MPQQSVDSSSNSSTTNHNGSGRSDAKRSFLCFVPGRPKSQGSKRPIKTKAGLRVVEQVKGLEAWRQDIKRWASEEEFKIWPRQTALTLNLTFFFLRPISVSEKKRPHVTVYPDIDKLARAACDALTSIIYVDDAQIVSLLVSKLYSDSKEGVLIHAEAKD